MPVSRKRRTKNNGSVVASKKKQFEIYYFNKVNIVQRAFIYNGTNAEINSVAMEHWFNDYEYFLIIVGDKIIYRSKDLNYKQTEKACSEIFDYRDNGEFSLIKKKSVIDNLESVKNGVLNLVQDVKSRNNLDKIGIHILPDLEQYLLDNNMNVEYFKNELIKNLNGETDEPKIN